MRIKAIGVSELVRDQDATFFTNLDTNITVLDPKRTELIRDTSPAYRTSRLFLEAVLRKTPLPASERRLAMAESFLLDRNPYQRRPAELALRGLRPRLLIADVVGLGKTLEIGLTLAELIRRGRGDRILVVTPQQVLDQFQRELWTRFSIPLIRLDSVGIARIQREIPAGRNPFTYYKRVIISIDTLKNVGQYRHHLEAIAWDAVVIDESHNVIGGSSLRAQLAKVLAPHTDALLLASATPHNGDRRSFADLIKLLDPTAIAKPADYRASDIDHLYIRRTKISPEVRDHIHDRWASRGPSVPIHCPASPTEERVFAELTEHWVPPDRSPGTGRDRLFAYTLLKAFLSSHKALAETATNRLKTLTRRPVDTSEPSGTEHERVALERLRDLCAEMTDDDSAKLRALVAELARIGVGPGSPVRAVIFSERVQTLTWLGDVVPRRLGFRPSDNAVRVIHGGISDQDEQKYIDQFGLASEPVRLLFTGDLASEGVNLHRQCHHLIHWDLPWSLIRIEQRNGRIDRFGQRQRPRFSALILTSSVPGAKDDRAVAEKLLAREAAAHASLGTAETVTGLYDANKEEERLTKALLNGETVEESLAASPRDELLASLLAPNQPAVPAEPAVADVPSLFEDAEAFTNEAIRELFGGDAGLELTREDNVLGLTPPPDLRRRLSVLPPGYLAEQRVNDRLLVTFDRDTADEYLRRAMADGTSSWPAVGYVSDLHPVIEWLVDKVLVRLDRQRALVLAAAVPEPVFLVQGVYSNAHGRPTVVEWMAVSGLPATPTVRPMVDTLTEAGVGPRMINRRGGDQERLAAMTALVPAAVDVARAHLEARRADWDAEIEASVREHRRRADTWEQTSLVEASSGAFRRAIADTADEQRNLADQSRTAGQPFLRVLAVLEPGV